MIHSLHCELTRDVLSTVVFNSRSAVPPFKTIISPPVIANVSTSMVSLSKKKKTLLILRVCFCFRL